MSEAVQVLPAPILLGRREAARLLSISARTLQEHTKKGVFPAVHLGGRVLYDPEDLKRTVQQLKTQAI